MADQARHSRRRSAAHRLTITTPTSMPRAWICARSAIGVTRSSIERTAMTDRRDSHRSGKDRCRRLPHLRCIVTPLTSSRNDGQITTVGDCSPRMRSASQLRNVGVRCRRNVVGGRRLGSRTRRSNVRCNRRALQALRLSAYLDLLIIGTRSHIEPTARLNPGVRRQRAPSRVRISI